MSRAKPSSSAFSLQASLDEENKEVLAAIEKQRSRSPVPRAARGVTPPPPIRSMLDVDSPSPSRHGSVDGAGVGTTSPRDQRKPSTSLNPADPSTWTRPHRTASPSRKQGSVSSPDLQTVPTIHIEGEQDNDSGSGIARSQSKDKKHRHSFSDVTTTSQRLPKTHQRNKSSGSASPQESPSRTPPTKTASSPKASKEEPRRFSNKSSSFSDISDTGPRLIRTTERGEEEVIVEGSDENGHGSSSEGESPEDRRGRSREATHHGDGDELSAYDNHGQGQLAPQSRGVRSLVDPVSSPSRPAHKSEDVHPPSSFGRSGPTLADFEEDPMEADIQKAKNLGLIISPVDDSIVDRHVRMIIRGKWAKLQEESENSNHTSRLYLACSDLSTEASYALEWTIGTMLRDGDTLLAIYGIEDETAPKEVEGNSTVIAESAKAAQQASETMETLTRQTTNQENDPKPTSKSTFIPATEASSLTSSVDTKNVSKKALERLKAMDEITQNFLKLVRKTPLQVRCMIEVIHCKSPKHLILNAIDELGPTLCVVGTRGRSSLKGVLLGSFSNYLVTKSSVPVMVARKRLKKPKHAKVSSSSIRLSNNLTNSIMPRQRKSLTQARID